MAIESESDFDSTGNEPKKFSREDAKAWVPRHLPGRSPPPPPPPPGPPHPPRGSPECSRSLDSPKGCGLTCVAIAHVFVFMNIFTCHAFVFS